MKSILEKEDKDNKLAEHERMMHEMDVNFETKIRISTDKHNKLDSQVQGNEYLMVYLKDFKQK